MGANASIAGPPIETVREALLRHLASRGLKPYLAVGATPGKDIRTHLIVVAPTPANETTESYLQRLVDDLRRSALAPIDPGLDFADGSYFQYIARERAIVDAPGSDSLEAVAHSILSQMVSLWQKVAHLTVAAAGPSQVHVHLEVHGEGIDSTRAQALEARFRQFLIEVVPRAAPGRQLSPASTVRVRPWPARVKVVAAVQPHFATQPLPRPEPNKITMRVRTAQGKEAVVAIEVEETSARRALEQKTIDTGLKQKLARALDVPIQEIDSGSRIVITGPANKVGGSVILESTRGQWEEKHKLEGIEVEDLNRQVASTLKEASQGRIDASKMTMKAEEGNRVRIDMPLDARPESREDSTNFLLRVVQILERMLADRGQRPAEGSVVRLPRAPAGWPARLVFEGGRWWSDSELGQKRREESQKRRVAASQSLYLIDMDRCYALPQRSMVIHGGFTTRSLGSGYLSNILSMDSSYSTVGLTIGLTDTFSLSLYDPFLTVDVDPVVDLFSQVGPVAPGGGRSESLGHFPFFHFRYVPKASGRWKRAYGLYFSTLSPAHREMFLPDDFDRTLSLYLAGERDLSSRMLLLLNLRYAMINTETPLGAADSSSISFDVGIDYRLSSTLRGQLALKTDQLGSDEIGVLGTALETGPYANFGVRWDVRPEMAMEVSTRGLGRTDFSETSLLFHYRIWP